MTEVFRRFPAAAHRVPQKIEGNSDPQLYSGTCNLRMSRLGCEIALRNLQRIRRLYAGKQIHRAGYNTGPPSLVTGPEPCPVVAMKILVEQNVIFPVRIFLELARASGDPSYLRDASAGADYLATSWRSLIAKEGAASSRDHGLSFDQGLAGTAFALSETWKATRNTATPVSPASRLSPFTLTDNSLLQRLTPGA